MSGKKKIIILGSTGSIGVNALNVVRQLPELFSVEALATFRNVDLLAQQAKEFGCRAVAVVLPESDTGPADLPGDKIILHRGAEGLIRLIEEVECDLVVNSIVGAAGFLPTLRAIELGRDIALANKETLVIGGEVITSAAKEHNCDLLPIDSEHSAIFQCLVGEEHGSIENIILTASGGPFRLVPKEQFKHLTVEQALKHPNWDMGSKITIDSATMMNKGLEIIEAHWLFGLDYDRIKVVIHPQSIIHSMVSFVDGSIKAQMGLPDMKVPIQYALTWPERKPSTFPRLDLSKVLELKFEPPDVKKFRTIPLAFEAGKTGGTAPAIMNAANEAAVQLFLQKQILFVDIFDAIEKALNGIAIIKNPSPGELLQADRQAREFVKRLSR